MSEKKETSRVVVTQAQLDEAVAEKIPRIYIESPEGVWLTIRNTGSSHVIARESSHVKAWGSSHVEAWDSSHVIAWESSHVIAWDSSHVIARESSHVKAWESSHVEAWGDSHVIARDSSRVEAWESSHVIARESSHVIAWESSHVIARESSHVMAREWSHVIARGSSHVEAWESSHVTAWGSSHVKAWESSRVEASTYTAVHIHSQNVTLNSTGAVVDCTAIDLSDVTTWCNYYGIKTNDGKAIVYKGVDNDLVAGHRYIPTTYSIGATVTASDWKNTTDCGYGLHFSPSPAATKTYHDAQRFLACEIDLENLVPLDDKCKAPSARVLYEVDVFGNRIERIIERIHGLED